MSIWKPHVTVAAIIEKEGRFLLVEEDTPDGVLLNQPAGHLEPGESLLAAVRRETLEESAWHFEPQHLVGIYQWRPPAHDLTYLRFSFAGALLEHEPARTLDTGILGTHWLTAEEIALSRARHRSPLVYDCVRDYLSGVRYPLALLHHYSTEY